MNPEILSKLLPRKSEVKCSKCGKKLIVPGMWSEKDRSTLKPYCCATTLLHIQWMIYHGWHVRNLGLHDNHPYFCSDCWEDGTPEYQKAEYGEQWVEQVKHWMQEQSNHK